MMCLKKSKVNSKCIIQIINIKKHITCENLILKLDLSETFLLHIYEKMLERAAQSLNRKQGKSSCPKNTRILHGNPKIT